jgi:hypothetical protein
MKRHVFDVSGKLLRVEEATPKCGVDFCDRCGDCLHCYRVGCYKNGDWKTGASCFWVVYEARGELDQ